MAEDISPTPQANGVSEQQLEQRGVESQVFGQPEQRIDPTTHVEGLGQRMSVREMLERAAKLPPDIPLPREHSSFLLRLRRQITRGNS